MTSLTTFAEANINGWSIIAVNAPADSVVKVLRAESEFMSHEEDASIHEIAVSEDGHPVDGSGNHLTTTVYPDRRCVVVVESVGCDWTVILRSIDFVYEVDIAWVRDTAKHQSKILATKALASYGEADCDFHVFDGGKSVKQLLGCEVTEAAKICESLSLSIPNCFLANDPAQVWASKSTRKGIRRVSLLTVSVATRETPSTQRRVRLPVERMVASTCLDIVKLKQFVPIEVRDESNSFEATIKEIVFDPLRIDEINDEFKAAGFKLDDELMKVIAVNTDGSVLVWFGITMVYQLRKGEENKKRAFNDILGLTFPFNIKNKKAEIDGMLTQLRNLYGEDT